MLAVALFLQHRCTGDLQNSNYFLIGKGCGGGIYLGPQQCLGITPLMRQNCHPPKVHPNSDLSQQDARLDFLSKL